MNIKSDFNSYKKDKKYYMKIGKAGELRIASELLLRGYNPSLMLEISEADIILSNGLKIQIKTSTRNHQRYHFSFKSWKKQHDKPRKQEKHKLLNIDFVILWGIENDYFFIIPVEKLKNATEKKKTATIRMFTEKSELKNMQRENDWIFKYQDRWDLLKK